MLHLVVLKDGRSLVNVEIEVKPGELDKQLVTVLHKGTPVMKFLTSTTAPLSVASEALRALSQSVRRMPVREDRR